MIIKSIINLPIRDSVHRFGIQCESEFSAQIFLTEIGIQCWSEFRPSRNSVREPVIVCKYYHTCVLFSPVSNWACSIDIEYLKSLS